ncbi:MAG: MarR family transcriptional regulator [Pseudomonadota bacterium]
MSQRASDALVAIRRIQRRIEIDTRRVAHLTKLTPSQLLVLQILDESGETSAGDIAKATRLSNATITSLVDKMVERGLVSRKRWHGDRRKVWLNLEDEGRQAIAEAPGSLQGTFETRFDGLEAWEQAMLVAVLEKVARMLDAETLDVAAVLDNAADLTETADPEQLGSSTGAEQG